jgi:hypothetical protein
MHIYNTLSSTEQKKLSRKLRRLDAFWRALLELIIVASSLLTAADAFGRRHSAVDAVKLVGYPRAYVRPFVSVLCKLDLI